MRGPWFPTLGAAVGNAIAQRYERNEVPTALAEPVTRNGTHPLNIPAEALEYQVRLCLPGPGGFLYGTLLSAIQACRKHSAQLPDPPIGTGWDSFNVAWAAALNAFERGEITHFAMLHADVCAGAYWLDTLIDEMDRLDAGLISVAIPIKDNRGVMSCGIGNPESGWGPLRRITSHELQRLPETFDAADFGYPGFPLLHNNGCWVADLRKPEFRRVDGTGCLRAFFDFPREVRRDSETGEWTALCESEDWYFSRKLHELGVRSFITRKVKVWHGHPSCNNYEPWGISKVDGDTLVNWGKYEDLGPKDLHEVRSDVAPEGVLSDSERLQAMCD